MTTIVTRAGKGSPLTNAEMDANLTNLNTDKAEIAGVQSQTYTAVTAGGTSTAVKLTPSPAITAYAAGQSFWVTFGAALGTNPTININGLGATVNLVYRTGGGAYANITSLPIGAYQIVLVSTTQALVVQAAQLPVGVEQTLQDVQASRAINTTYTNSTGRSIFVYLSVSCSAAGNLLL